MSTLAILLILFSASLGVLGVTSTTKDKDGRLTGWGKTALGMLVAGAMVGVWQQLATQAQEDASRRASERKWAEQAARSDQTLRLVTKQLELGAEQLRLSTKQLQSVEATLDVFQRSQWAVTRELHASATLIMFCGRLPESLQAEICAKPLEEHAYVGALSKRNREILEKMLPLIHLEVWRRDEVFGESQRKLLFQARVDMAQTRGPIGEAYDFAHNEETAEVTITCDECLDVDVTFVSQQTTSFQDFADSQVDLDFLAGGCDAQYVADLGGYPCVPAEIQLMIPSGRRIYLRGFDSIDDYSGVFRASLSDVTGPGD